MNISISQQDVASFARDGVVCLRQVIPSYWVETVASGMARNLASPGPHHSYADGAERRFFQDANNWQRVGEYEAFARCSPAAEIAGRLLASEKVVFLHDHVLIKQSGASKATPWHQDQPYSPVEGSQMCTMWMPIDPVSRDTALECIAGSHLPHKWYRPQRFIDGSFREGDDPNWAPLPDIDANRAAWPIVGWAMEPGDVLVFHGLTLHGAPGNASGRPRRILSTRWLGDDARVRRRGGKMSPPLPDDEPADGSPFDSTHFPVVWRSTADSTL